MNEVEKIFQELLKKVNLYKKKSGKTYNEIAEEIGMSKYSFANLRADWKKNKGYPRKKTLEKLKRILSN